MTSINEQQPEHHREDLAGLAAIAKIRALVGKSRTCFFCTAIQTGQRIETRPMTIQEIDDAGHLWFLSASDSTLNTELARDSAAQLMVQGSEHSDFLTLYGEAKVSRDRERIEALWNPLMKTWFTGGIDDPRITVIRVTPRDGYYWDTKHNRMIVFAKIVAGAVTGKTFDDGIEGTLHV